MYLCNIWQENECHINVNVPPYVSISEIFNCSNVARVFPKRLPKLYSYLRKYLKLKIGLMTFEIVVGFFTSIRKVQNLKQQVWSFFILRELHLLRWIFSYYFFLQ